MKVRVASAGTGKTTSLVLRYLELIRSGTPLRRIAGVTFTRAAADELRQRVGAGILELLTKGNYLHHSLDIAQRPLFEEALRELDGATLTTIHGFMIESLRLVAPMMGLDPDFSVLGEWEAQAMFEEELRSVLYLASAATHGLYNAKTLLGDDAESLVISIFQQRSLTQTFESDDSPVNLALQKLFDAAYRKFEVRLGASLLPPSEVERRALKMIRNQNAVERLISRYKIVLVDEFQDVNPLQGAYFEALETAGLATEVVGDPKQSIYGFRNADVEVFRRALARGEKLEPLTHTRRHAKVVSRFLNHMTNSLAANNRGFGTQEAPVVETKGEQENTQGRVELHWIVGDEPIANLRTMEANVLAERLKYLHDEGYSFNDMAVLARSYAGLAQVEEALLAKGLPYVLLQGRGYYDRTEVRDVYHALRVGIEASGLSFAAWLRGPFVQLDFLSVDEILKAAHPLEILKEKHRNIWERLEQTRQHVRGTPLAALKFLIREPFIEGKRYVDFLETRARENVDALLFTVAEQPPGDIELLLDRLEQLSRQTDAGDVPQSGEGIELLTVHKSKGLEWNVAAVFDLGRKLADSPQAVYIHDSNIVHKDTSSFEEARTYIRQREEEESYRLLYVAASRARDILVMTGSAKGNKADGWITALETMKLGPSSKPYSRPEFILQTHLYQPIPQPSTFNLQPSTSDIAPWIDKRFHHHDHPPVSSPSRLKQESYEDLEPLPFSDPDEGERLPGRSTTVGTLVHYAISQNWNSSNPIHVENLRAQEVMFPFTPDEQQDILVEVKELVSNYESLLGSKLPGLGQRSHDFPELPMAIPVGKTVWQGIIDRLYCANGQWILEDYKTDQEIKPEHYYFQLAVYLQAIREVRGVTPKVQLIFLRFKEVVVIEESVLEETYKEVLADQSP
ncbi:MAG: UvrD-helicase domain-containing protein [Trueperaceae bacterium]